MKYERCFQLYWKHLTTDQFGWHMIPLPGASGSNKSRKITREGSFSIWANSRVKDETYFPPQKIFVVITKLERLEKEKKKKVSKHLLQHLPSKHAEPTSKKSTGVAYAQAQTIIFRSFMRFYLILSASLSHTSYNNGVCARTQTMPVNECCEHINLIWYNLSYTNTHTGPTK